MARGLFCVVLFGVCLGRDIVCSSRAELVGLGVAGRIAGLLPGLFVFPGRVVLVGLSVLFGR